MTTNIHNQGILGKFSELMFARQPRLAAAERHRSLRNSFSNWRARRAARAELSRLSDRELADIGVTRQDIAEVVDHGK